jgi:hypothetical protein
VSASATLPFSSASPSTTGGVARGPFPFGVSSTPSRRPRCPKAPLSASHEVTRPFRVPRLACAIRCSLIGSGSPSETR